jgi:large conductance mechanosensitive channel
VALFHEFCEKKAMLKEFKEFALKGSVLDLAVGIIVGAAFTKVVNSLVTDILMPPLGLLTRSSDFVKQWGIPLHIPGNGEITIRIGSFLDSLVQFLIVAFAIFLLVRAINRLRAPGPAPETPPAPATRECPFCTSAIPLRATRCPHCTSQIPPA